MKEGKSAISRQFPRLVQVPNKGGTGTTYAEAKWYRYHLCRGKMVPVPTLVGTSTTHQNKVGTGTDPSGTDTTAPCSPDFLYFYNSKPKFIHQ